MQVIDSTSSISEETILNDIGLSLPLRDNYDHEIRKILKNPVKSTIRITSFMLYKSFFLKEYKHFYGDVDFRIREITKTIAKAWNEETNDIKLACKQLAEELQKTKKEKFDDGKVELVISKPYKKKEKKLMKKDNDEIDLKQLDKDNRDLKKIIKDQEDKINNLSDKLKRYKNNKKEIDNDISNNNILSLLIPRITQIEKSIEELKTNQNSSTVNLTELDLANLFYNLNNFQIPIIDNSNINMEIVNENNTRENENSS